MLPRPTIEAFDRHLLALGDHDVVAHLSADGERLVDAPSVRDVLVSSVAVSADLRRVFGGCADMTATVVAALKLWEWHVVQPAAQRLFGQPVVRITHFGSYSCRRMYGRSSGDFSEHATADAIEGAWSLLAFVGFGGNEVEVPEFASPAPLEGGADLNGEACPFDLIPDAKLLEDWADLG